MSLNYEAIERKRLKRGLGLTAGHFAVVLATGGVVLSLTAAFQNLSALTAEHEKLVQAQREVAALKAQLGDIAGKTLVVRQKAKAISEVKGIIHTQETALNEMHERIAERVKAMKAGLQKIEKTRASGAKAKRERSARLAKLKEEALKEAQSLRQNLAIAETSLAKSREALASLTRELEEAMISREQASLPVTSEGK